MRKFSMAKKVSKPAKRGPYKSQDVEDPDLPGFAGILVRRHRMMRAWTVEQLAEASKLSPGTISGLERGTVGFSKDSLAKLANAFEITIGELFEADDGLLAQIRRLEPAKKQRVADFIKGLGG